jgi:hypothetical protein
LRCYALMRGHNDERTECDDYREVPCAQAPALPLLVDYGRIFAALGERCMQLVPPNCFKCNKRLLSHARPGFPEWTKFIVDKKCGVIVCASGRLTCGDCCREQGSAEAFKTMCLPPRHSGLFPIEAKLDGTFPTELDTSKGQWTRVRVQINSVQQGLLQTPKVNFCKIPEVRQSTSQFVQFTVNCAKHHGSIQTSVRSPPGRPAKLSSSLRSVWFDHR